MILIITVVDDWSSHDIIDWLQYKKQTFFRFNADEINNYLFSIELNNAKQVVRIHDKNTGKKLVSSDEITNIWFRRSARIEPLVLNLQNTELEKEIRKTMFSEMQYFMRAVYETLGTDKKWLNHHETSTNDKIKTLCIAQKCGIEIPDTLLTTSREELEAFYKKHQQKVIVKAIYNITHLPINEDEVYLPFTALLSEEDIQNLNVQFFPSLCQSCLDKEYEIRTFFLDGKFYSMAIFSQQDEQTKLDFRVYNYELPNRRVPYSLPKEIEDKCLILMRQLNLNSGSLDFIKTKDGKWIFLEVNPVGQFGMTSYPCNYFLERELAHFLIAD